MPLGNPRQLVLTSVGLACCILVVAIFVWLMHASWLETVQTESLSSANLATTLGQNVERNIEVLDASLKGAARNWTDPRVQELPADLRDTVLFDGSTLAAGYGDVFILDRTGAVQASQRPVQPAELTASSRDYFIVHVGNKEVGLFVSRPFRNALTRKWVVALSRRITDADGQFAGVVVGTIELSFLETLLAKVDLGKHGLAGLLRLDGTIVAQVPVVGPERLNQHVDPDRFAPLRVARVGSIEGPSAFDGQDRITSFRRLDSLPLIQVVEIKSAGLIVGWWRRTIGLGIVILTLTAGSLSLFLMLSRELTRRTRAEAELSKIAQTDALTALGNRMIFDAALEQALGQARRERSDLSLLMIDADYFKLYNDALGHPAGDRVLRLVADCIRASLHWPGDLPCRIGGEEFAVLLIKTDAKGARRIAEAIRSAVEDLQREHPGSPLGVVTVSIGAASLSQCAGTADQLVATADRALYQAKHAGRNCVRYAGADDIRLVA